MYCLQIFFFFFVSFVNYKFSSFKYINYIDGIQDFVSHFRILKKIIQNILLESSLYLI